MEKQASSQGTLLITGATGMVGRALSRYLLKQGYRVVGLLRPKGNPAKLVQGVQPLFMDVMHPAPRDMHRLDALGPLEAVIHLAGESIMGIWTQEKRNRIRHSRREGTRKLAELLCSLERPPRVFISASAIGIYGRENGDRLLKEDASYGSDFLASVCQEWEAASDVLVHAGVRCAHARFGVILAREGGALKAMLPAFRLGVAGPLGNGEQWMSWVHISDVVGALHHILNSPLLHGPINVVAPHPVTNATFTRQLAEALQRPAFIPAPAFLLKVGFGELADSLLLASQRCEPERLRETNYAFQHPTLEEALRSLV
jgi:uncharacterized protein